MRSKDDVLDKKYTVLEQSLQREKDEDKTRSYKRHTKFIERADVKRSTYHKRSKSLIRSAKELEVLTHCKVSVHVEPTWEKGKTWTYSSPPEKTDNSTVKSHQNELPSFLTDAVINKIDPEDKNLACRVCGSEEPKSFWLGCDHRNTKTKRLDCHFWVHQNCIGLYCATEELLEEVTYYCPKHGPKHKQPLRKNRRR